MRDTNGAGARKARRRRIIRIVLGALVFAAVVEPLVMYRVLVRERAERRVVAEAPLAPSTDGPAR